MLCPGVDASVLGQVVGPVAGLRLWPLWSAVVCSLPNVVRSGWLRGQCAPTTARAIVYLAEDRPAAAAAAADATHRLAEGLELLQRVTAAASAPPLLLVVTREAQAVAASDMPRPGPPLIRRAGRTHHTWLHIAPPTPLLPDMQFPFMHCCGMMVLKSRDDGGWNTLFTVYSPSTQPNPGYLPPNLGDAQITSKGTRICEVFGAQHISTVTTKMGFKGKSGEKSVKPQVSLN